VSTTSTKSSRKKASAKNASAKKPGDADAIVDNAEMSERVWQISALGILIVGTILRLYYLALVPLHHDEGVNGNFLVTLVREGKYTYNPRTITALRFIFSRPLFPGWPGFWAARHSVKITD